MTGLLLLLATPQEFEQTRTKREELGSVRVEHRRVRWLVVQRQIDGRPEQRQRLVRLGRLAPVLCVNQLGDALVFRARTLRPQFGVFGRWSFRCLL